jgi:hypothetical protein
VKEKDGKISCFRWKLQPSFVTKFIIKAVEVEVFRGLSRRECWIVDQRRSFVLSST